MRAARGVTLALAALGVVALSVMGVAGAQPGGEQVDDAALIERLAELDPSLPQPAPPTAVDADAERLRDAIDGDVTGAHRDLEEVAGELASLHADADDADGAVAEAVARIARGWSELERAYAALADWSSHDLALPDDARDDDEVATGADEIRGTAERGLRLVLMGQERLLSGYQALDGLEPIEEPGPWLAERLQDAEAFDEDARPGVQRVLSLPAPTVLVHTDRFETSAPGVDARARAYRVWCVDRQRYAEAQGELERADRPGAEALVPGEGESRADCPDLPDGLSAAEEPAGGEQADDGDAENADEEGSGAGLGGDADAGPDGDAEQDDEADTA